MKKYIFAFILITLLSIKISAQSTNWEYLDSKLFFTGGNVGIGKNNPLSKLDVLGNIQISTGVNPISLNYDTLGMNPVLNISVNAKEVDKRTYYRGAYFKIDTRTFATTTPTFQWIARPPLSAPEKVLMTLNEEGNLGVGIDNPLQKLQIAGSVFVQSKSEEGNIRITNNIGSWENNHLNLSYKNNNAYIDSIGTNTNLILEKDSGNIGIGTEKPTKKLSVNGTILAKEVIISDKSIYWPDYVFKSDYNLLPLSFVNSFINKNKHLPNVPSEKEVYNSGLSIGAMQKIQMEKIEELFLYVIELEQKIKQLEKNINM